MIMDNMYRSVAALFRRFCADRRGATALVFALGATALFGLVGLATEGGTWYLEKRHGQNAADAAAMAGVVALANGQNATTSGTKVAALTGDTNGLAITTGIFSSGTFTAGATPATAVKAVITSSRTPLFSGLFLNSAVTISESAVATLAATGPVCMLAGKGGLSFGGSTSVTAAGCTFASNQTGSQSISGASTSHVSASQSLVSAGGCSGCTGLSTPPLTYQPPTPLPAALTTIESLTLPQPHGNNPKCNNSSSTPLAYNSTNPPTVNCNGLSMTGWPTVNLTPGTYIFYNSSISLNNGTLECTTCTGTGTSGVTIILTGSSPSNIGTIDIKGNVTVHLMAPATSDFDPAFNGVLFYTDSNAPLGNSVKLTGDSSSTYGGAMYFPSSNVTFIGNSGANVPTCSELIGYSLNFTGNSGFNISGCSARNVTQTRTVRLAQ
jgi:Flp pilus assembly protein TadG